MNKEPLLNWNEFDALIMELRQIADLVHVVSLTLEDTETSALGAINSLMMRIVKVNLLLTVLEQQQELI